MTSFGLKIQSTLVTSTSFISNNPLSRSGNLVPVTCKSNNRYVNILEKRSKITYSFMKCGCSIYLFFSISILQI